MTDAPPSPASYAPRVTGPAQAAAIRSRRAISPASAPVATGSADGHCGAPPFSQSTTVVSARPSTESGAGGIANVSDWTRGGSSGLSWIAAATVPRSPVSHHRRCAGLSESAGRPASTVNAPILSRSSARSPRRSAYGRSSATFAVNSASAVASSQSLSSPFTASAAARVCGHGPPAPAPARAGARAVEYAAERGTRALSTSSARAFIRA